MSAIPDSLEARHPSLGGIARLRLTMVWRERVGVIAKTFGLDDATRVWGVTPEGR